MKRYFKGILVAIMTVVGLILQGCGGTSGSGSGNVFDEARTTNSRGALPYASTSMANENILEDVDTEDYDLMTLIGMHKNLSTFAALAKMANLEMKLDNLEAVTMFVPTNKAFKDMPLEKFNMLTDPQNRAHLIRFVNRHILPSKVKAINLTNSKIIETAGEEEITVDGEMVGDVFYVGGAEVVKADIEASNGVIHIVNAVVEPNEDVLLD